MDKAREEIEDSDAQLKQFSIERDQPFIDDYKRFIQEQTTKEVLNLFSADYEENSVQNGSKASTAKQYSLRLLEFFNFLSEKYNNFHFDWLTDYSEQIEKKHQNNEQSTAIFVLTSDDIATFVNKFKVGSTETDHRFSPF